MARRYDGGDGCLRPQPREDRAGADDLHPVQQAGLRPQPLLRIVQVGCHAGLQSRHRNTAVGVVQGGDQPDQGGDASGTAPPNMPL